MDKKVVLLLGSNGLIGKEIFIMLQEEVVLIEYDRHRSIFHCDNEVLNHKKWYSKVTHIINCAGLNRGSLELLTEANVNFPTNIAEEISKHNSKFIFIQISSYGIYNGKLSLKNLEKRTPINDYEFSKADVLNKLAFLKERLVVIHPTNVVEDKAKKSIFRFLFWPVKSRILLTSTKDLALVCLDYIQTDSKLKEQLVVSSRIESGFFEMYTLKRLIHKCLIKYGPGLVPYYLYFLEYREE